MNKQKRIALYKAVWCKIRYWQQLHDMTDEELASYLNCTKRTLQNYDRDAKNLTFQAVDSFLYINDMTLEELLAA